MLAIGADIAVTHATLINATEETINRIQQGGYTLILDEAIDVIQKYNNLSSVKEAHQTMNETNMQGILLEKNFVSIESDNKVNWIGRKHDDGFQYSEFERLSSLGRMYYFSSEREDGESKLLVVLPPDIFRSFKDIYVLTYQFRNSLFQYYFDYYGFQYQIMSIGENGLQEYTQDADRRFREQCKMLITLHHGGKNKRSYLSSNWYDHATKAELTVLKRKLENYYGNVLRKTGYKSADAMWTCPKKKQKNLSGKGYTMRGLTDDERKLLAPEAKSEVQTVEQKPEKKRKASTAEREKIKEDRLRFVPCTARATNKYKDRWALAYFCNMHYDPLIMRFFTSGNEQRKAAGISPIVPSNDAYALSCLIQWVCRSRIRDGKKIHLYIESKRMYDLFVDWMNGKDLQSTTS